MKHKIIIKKQQKKTTLIVNGLRNERSTKEKKNYYLESYQNYIQLKIKNKNHSKQNHI